MPTRENPQYYRYYTRTCPRSGRGLSKLVTNKLGKAADFDVHYSPNTHAKGSAIINGAKLDAELISPGPAR